MSYYLDNSHSFFKNTLDILDFKITQYFEMLTSLLLGYIRGERNKGLQNSSLMFVDTAFSCTNEGQEMSTFVWDVEGIRPGGGREGSLAGH